MADDVTVYVSSSDDYLEALQNSVEDEDFIVYGYNLQILSPDGDGVAHINDGFGSLKISFAVPSEYSQARIYYFDSWGCESTGWLSADDEGMIDLDLSSIQEVGPYANMLLAVSASERGLVLKRNSSIESLGLFMQDFDESDYSESDWDWIEVYLASGEKAIRIAASDEAIDEALSLAKTNILAVPKTEKASASSDEIQSETPSNESKDEETDLSKTGSLKDNSTDSDNNNDLTDKTFLPIASSTQGGSNLNNDSDDDSEDGSSPNTGESEQDSLSQTAEDEPTDDNEEESVASDSSSEDMQEAGMFDFLTDWRFLSVLLGLLVAFMIVECVVYLVQKRRFMLPYQSVQSPVSANESDMSNKLCPEYTKGMLEILLSQ